MIKWINMSISHEIETIFIQNFSDEETEPWRDEAPCPRWKKLSKHRAGTGPSGPTSQAMLSIASVSLLPPGRTSEGIGCICKTGSWILRHPECSTQAHHGSFLSLSSWTWRHKQWPQWTEGEDCSCFLESRKSWFLADLRKGNESRIGWDWIFQCKISHLNWIKENKEIDVFFTSEFVIVTSFLLDIERELKGYTQ